MKTNKTLRIFNILLGLVSVGFFIYDWILLKRIRPQMESWGTLTTRDTNLLLIFGIGLLILVIFYGFTLIQIMRVLRHSRKLPVGMVLAFVLVAIAALFVVSVVVLMNDITNQFEAGFLQPEWNLVYPDPGGPTGGHLALAGTPCCRGFHPSKGGAGRSGCEYFPDRPGCRRDLWWGWSRNVPAGFSLSKELVSAVSYGDGVSGGPGSLSAHGGLLAGDEAR